MIKISKREKLSKSQEVYIRLLAIVLSLVLVGFIISILGYNPIDVFINLIDGAIGTELRINQVILRSIPLIITSMGIIIAFKMKFWNIGGEGQIAMGAFGATIAVMYLPSGLSPFIMLLAMVLASIIFGGLWAFIPAILKAKFNTNETILTLMLNYIAIKWITYLQFGPWKDPESSGFPRVKMFPDEAILPELFGIHIGWIFAIVGVIFTYVFINFTKKGYQISVVGESVDTAKYAGINIKSVIITAMLFSGGLCGLTGMIEASAMEKTLTYTITGGYGFTAIITSWLGKLSPPLVAVVCVLFAMLIQGGSAIQISLNVPASVADIIQGSILFFVLGSEFFLQYKLRFARSEREAN